MHYVQGFLYQMKKKKIQKPTKRYRQVFWLDIYKPDELELLHLIPSLKDKGLFTAYVRDGLRLINDLRQGSFDVLFELFPDAKQKFRSDEFDRLAKLIETRSFETTSTNATSLSEVNTAGLGFKSYTPPLASLSLADDLSLEVSKAESNSNSAQNLMDSLFGL